MDFRRLRVPLVIFAILAGVLLLGIGILYFDHAIAQQKGYGYIWVHPEQPWWRSMKILWKESEFFQNYGEKYPPPVVLASSIPELSLPKTQPYSKFDIHVIEAKAISQVFLYSPDSLTLSETRKNTYNLLYKNIDVIDKGGLFGTVVLCVKADGREPNGVYRAYKEYPLKQAEGVGQEAWKNWSFMMDCDFVPLALLIVSDTPPIPGCLVYTDTDKPQSNKFYYPEQILPAVKAIYPNINIPEEQILRKKHSD